MCADCLVAERVADDQPQARRRLRPVQPPEERTILRAEVTEVRPGSCRADHDARGPLGVERLDRPSQDGAGGGSAQLDRSLPAGWQVEKRVVGREAFAVDRDCLREAARLEHDARARTVDRRLGGEADVQPRASRASPAENETPARRSRRPARPLRAASPRARHRTADRSGTVAEIEECFERRGGRQLDLWCAARRRSGISACPRAPRRGGTARARGAP